MTSRERDNLDGERPVRLDGLSDTEGRDLFVELAKNQFPKVGPSENIKKALEEISRKAGGHPLSIELLARSYRRGGLSNIREMLEHMGAGVINPKEETERLQSLESCFEYSFSRLTQTQKDLLPKLIIFNSPFPAGAVEEIFDFEECSEILSDLHDHSLLRRIEFDEYSSGDEDIDAAFQLYYFHPAIRNYLEHKAVGEANTRLLEEAYADPFSSYYLRFLEETNNALWGETRALSVERFKAIWQGKDNDIDRAVRLARDRSLGLSISYYLGQLLMIVGSYVAALEHLKKALAIEEEQNDVVGLATVYTNIGLVLQAQGNYDQALEYYMKSLQIDEKLNATTRIAGDYANIGRVFLGLGNYDQGLEYLKKALELNPNDPILLNSNAWLLALLDRKTLALERVDKALSLDPENIHALHTKGFILHNLCEYDEAIIFFEKGIALDPKFAIAWYDSARSRTKKDNVEGGLTYLKRAIELGGNEFKEKAKREEDFAPLINDSRFHELIS